MEFNLDDEQQMLAGEVQKLLQAKSSPQRLRALLAEGAAWDEPLWRRLAALGFLGAGVPEAYGGLGLGGVEAFLIAAEIGRSVAALPFVSSLGLAAEAILLAGTEAQKRQWLPRLVSGETVGCFAHAEGSLDCWSARPQCLHSDGRLSGEKFPVADAGIAQIAVIACRREDSIALALVELDHPSVQRRPLECIDHLRPHHRLRFDNTPAEPLQEGEPAAHLRALRLRAATFAAFEQVGGSDACLAMALAYVAQREVFGRTLSSYQAVKHKLADLFVEIELARASAQAAAEAIVNNDADAPALAAVARLRGCAAFEMAAQENLHLHGGIGYTWDADCHFYYRRERLLALALGGTERWSDWLIETLAPDARLLAA